MTTRANAVSRYRKILEMREKKGMSFEEIGDVLGITRQRAHELYHRASKRNLGNSDNTRHGHVLEMAS